ncbi:universal stress protein [Thiomonas sp. FB-Cd]|uniref:universal stress protein n=1 Tax=Thiomonas sp. FB-Cd TaxID=1158292 RepID=UPI0004DF6C15|nr:universal stress protein [Thiomonas sp. FB-Cd]
MDSHLCVAIDGSLVAGATLQHAIDGLAHEQRAQLPLAHVMDVRGMSSATDAVVEPQSQRRPELIGRASANVSRRCVQVKSRLSQAVGGQRLSTLRAELARAVGADLFVLGRHRRRGAVPLLVGGVTEGVARLGSVRVLIEHRPWAADARSQSVNFKL